MMINDVTQAATAITGRRKKRLRVGRGESSGKGKTAGRGHKGCQSRSGGGVNKLTEGGQVTVARRFPKRGFSNVNFATRFTIINLSTLNEMFDDGDTVDLTTLRKRRLISGRDPVVKILGDGALSKKLTIHAHAVSANAKSAIEKSGSSLHQIVLLDRAAAWREKRRYKVKERIAKYGRPSAKTSSSAPAAPQAAPAPAEAPTEPPAQDGPTTDA